MFVSHFTKREWLKISRNFYFDYYWKYAISLKKKKLLLCLGFIYLILLIFFFKYSPSYWTKLTLAIIFLMCLAPFSTMLICSPTTLICFYAMPSEEEKEKIKTIYGITHNNPYGLSLDYERNILLRNRPYDVLIDTNDYFLVYSFEKVRRPRPTTLLIIKKEENKIEIGDEGQHFLKLVLPHCKKYIKKTD